MNHSLALRSRRAARVAAGVTAAVALSQVVAACGSSSRLQVAQLGATTPSQASQMLAFSRCMRSHGEPTFPDPDAHGQIKQQLRASGIDENTPRDQTAVSACHRVLPDGGNSGTTQAEVQQEWSEFRSFTRCMRRHGVPTWPEPQPRSATDPRPIFGIQPVAPNSPINPDSPQIKSKLPACDSLLKTANPNRL